MGFDERFQAVDVFPDEALQDAAVVPVGFFHGRGVGERVEVVMHPVDGDLIHQLGQGLVKGPVPAELPDPVVGFQGGLEVFVMIAGGVSTTAGALVGAEGDGRGGRAADSEGSSAAAVGWAAEGAECNPFSEPVFSPDVLRVVRFLSSEPHDSATVRHIAVEARIERKPFLTIALRPR